MVHKYRFNDVNIVLDVNSGSVHVFSDCAFAALDSYKSQHLVLDGFTAEETQEAYAEIAELEAQGLLFSEDISQEVLKQAQSRQPVVKALCLLVAHDCNLKCAYCFAGEGEYRGERGMMSIETACKAVDFLIRNSGTRRNLEIDFFGGEPLMNFDVVKAVVAYATSLEAQYNKNFRFTLTTNGLLLNDENLEYINRYMDNLVFSLDGRKAVNDAMRFTKNGGGSYDLIVPKLVKAAQSRIGKDFYVRGTFTRHNLDFGKDVLHLASLGFKNISVEPVAGGVNNEFEIKGADLGAACSEYDQLALGIIKRKGTEESFNFFHFMIDLAGGPCAAKRLYGCGAGAEYLSVSADGSIYPCHQFAGIQEFKMGTVDGLDEEKAATLRANFEQCNVLSKDECKNCFAKFYCGGGCAANAYLANHDINKPYEPGCVLQKKRTEVAIGLKAFE